MPINPTDYSLFFTQLQYLTFEFLNLKWLKQLKADVTGATGFTGVTGVTGLFTDSKFSLTFYFLQHGVHNQPSEKIRKRGWAPNIFQNYHINTRIPDLSVDKRK